ncbi:MAG: ABC transporter ATP-binding protein [Bdellovibrionales bacterium]|nr:ABC transporter ATP-binding protein [Bdellovibrionales bacterium]
MAVVEFQNVTKTYPLYHHLHAGLKGFIFNLPSALKGLNSGFTALKDLSFKINEGESVAFIGRNGAGKSTTLSLIAGVIRPTKGQVMVSKRVSPLLELGGGFHHELTGRENIQLNGVLLGLTRRQVAEKLDEIVAFAELGEFIDQPIRSYSTGMIARLGFSVVAHLEPELLLIDEVLAVGDASFQKKCIAKMKQFRDQGVSVVMVSHNAPDIEMLCSRVIWIENHQIVGDGPTSLILPKYLESMK